MVSEDLARGPLCCKPLDAVPDEQLNFFRDFINSTRHDGACRSARTRSDVHRHVERDRRGCGLRPTCCANLASYSPASRPAAARSPAAVQGAGPQRQGHLCRCEPSRYHTPSHPASHKRSHPASRTASRTAALRTAHSALAHQPRIPPAAPPAALHTRLQPHVHCGQTATT